MYAGTGDSFGTKYNLVFSEQPWFEELHKKFITKQKFFNEISQYEEIVNGLRRFVGS